MEILHTFGLNPFLLAAQVVNFLVLLYLMKRFLYPPLFKVFKKREELIKESIQKAEESQKALDKAQEKEKAIVKEARTTAEQIVKDAREQADTIIKQAEVKTKEQTDKMLKDAKSQIELETAQAQSKLNKYVLTLSLDLLKKSLSDVFTDKEQSTIIEKATKEMQKQPN